MTKVIRRAHVKFRRLQMRDAVPLGTGCGIVYGTPLDIDASCRVICKRRATVASPESRFIVLDKRIHQASRIKVRFFVPNQLAMPVMNKRDLRTSAC